MIPSEIRMARAVPNRRGREPQGPQEQRVLVAWPGTRRGETAREAKGKGTFRAKEVEGRETQGGQRGQQHQGGRVQ